MKIPSPFIPLRVESKEFTHTVDVIGRSYKIGADGMITSIISGGNELLASPPPSHGNTPLPLRKDRRAARRFRL